MDFASGGDFKILLDKKGRLEENEAKFYICELIEAVNYLHSENIVHRDLKPDNMLISSKGHVKLTDFGLSEIKI